MTPADPAWIEIPPQEARTLLSSENERIGVLDVRKAEEWVKGHIPGATHIPLDELPLRLGELDPHREWIVVCRTGNRSAKACAYLAERGFRVRNMRGGILAWNETEEKEDRNDGYSRRQDDPLRGIILSDAGRPDQKGDG